MIYVLLIWTSVAGTSTRIAYDWRQLAEFHSSTSIKTEYDAQAKCEAAAKEIERDAKLYRCVRTK